MKYILLNLILTATFSLAAQDQQTIRVALDSSIQSQALGYEKHIQVVVPTTYVKESNNVRPLIIVFDMQNSINYNYILNSIEYLSGFGQMPECIVVGIEAAAQNGRYYETQLKENSPDALGAENETFIFDELIPFIQNQYKASEQIILFGHSRFGYYTTHLLTQRPNELLGVISVSPFYVQKNTNHVDRLVDVLSEVVLEHDLYYIQSVGDTLVDTDQFYNMDEALASMDLPDRFKYHPLIHDASDHITTPGLTAAESFYQIFRKWSVLEMQYHRTSRTDLQTYHSELQEAISASYGASIPFSLGIYNGTGWKYYNDDQFEPAIECWESMMEYYPSFSYGWVFIASALKELGKTGEIESYLLKAEYSIRGNVYLTKDELVEIANEISKIRQQ